MSDDSDTGVAAGSEPTMAEIIAGVEPMGDLGRFVISDMTEEEENTFFSILEDA